MIWLLASGDGSVIFRGTSTTRTMPLSDFLQRSEATPAFQAAVASFLRTGQPNERVGFDHYSPPVKVERALTKALETYPDLPIESFEIEGTSGCEYYRGELVLRTRGEEVRVRFNWDCKWRALQEGWTDYFGFPDQIRAARQFGYDCFKVWTEEARVPLAVTAP